MHYVQECNLRSAKFLKFIYSTNFFSKIYIFHFSDFWKIFKKNINEGGGTLIRDRRVQYMCKFYQCYIYMQPSLIIVDEF